MYMFCIERMVEVKGNSLDYFVSANLAGKSIAFDFQSKICFAICIEMYLAGVEVATNTLSLLPLKLRSGADLFPALRFILW